MLVKLSGLWSGKSNYFHLETPYHKVFMLLKTPDRYILGLSPLAQICHGNIFICYVPMMLPCLQPMHDTALRHF